MRIVRLECRAFGPFTDHTLEFADGRHGLHVVFGPNEAGKTSSLRALHQLLFGIPHASTDNFLHAHPDLRIGATLRRHDGAHVSFVRRKGMKNTLRGADDVAVVSPEELNSLLPNIDEQTFRRRFGIDYDELQKGGQAVAEGKGDLAEVLFAAGAGVANLGRMLQQLEEAAQTLYTSRSTKARINKGMAAIKEARQRLQQARLPTATYLKLDEALQETRAEADQIARELAERRTRRSRLVRFDSAMPLVSENLRCLQELAELADAPRLPENAAEVRAESRATIEYCRTQIERIDRELAQLAEEQQGLSVAEDLLAAGKVVEPLQQRLGSHRKAAQDRVQLEGQCSELTRRAMHLKSDIQGNAGDQQLDAVQPSGRERVRIQNLGGELQKLESRHQAVEQQLYELSARLAKAQGESDRLPHPIDATLLKQAVRAARQLGNIDERCATLRQQRARAEAELASQLQRLPLWQGDSRQLADVPVVAAETVERWEGLWMAAEDEQQRLREREAEQLKLLSDAEEHLARLSLEQDVPTLHDLDAAREERDSAWSNVRRRLASSASREQTPGQPEQTAPSNGELADWYEQSVRAADRLADRLRTEADRVAAKAALLARQRAIRQWLIEHRQAQSAAAVRQADMDQEWAALWQPAGISPLSPREMRGWLARFQQILTQADELRRQQDELAREDEQRAAACRQLSTALSACGAAPSDSGDDRRLQPLVELAEEQLEACESQRLRREQLVTNLRELSEEIPRLTSAREASRAEWQAVRTQWEQALASLFLPPEATPAEAHEVMQTFLQLRECEREIEGLRERIQGIDADARQFREDVVSIVGQFAPDLADASPDEAVGGLYQRWQRARQQHEQLRRVRAEQTKRQQERANHLERMEAAQARLNVLLADAACRSLDELPVAEQRSARRRWCESQHQQLAQQLTRLAGHEPLPAFLAEAAQLDADQLQSSLSALTTEIEELERRQRETATRIGSLENQLQQVSAGDQAQDVEAEIQELAASLQGDLDEYMRLRTGAVVLRKAMERYRERNQGPILQGASRRFAELTCGSFTGLRAEYGDQDSPFLVGIRASTGQTIPVTAMSTGTRDQLYLAVRLASLEHYLDQHPPIPFIVDDILVQFDDDRSAATLRVLAEVGRRTQVIFFTHHLHLVQLARQCVAPEELSVHELTPREPRMP